MDVLYHPPSSTFKRVKGKSSLDLDDIICYLLPFRQMNMDYSLSQALGSLNGIQRVLVLYDIMCQYGIHLQRRFNDSPYLSLPNDLVLKTGIGIWHVNGHVPECFVRYAPLFIDGAGHVDGEILETLWSSLNEISGSTRGMSTSHRRELLDDHMNDSNWKKLTRIGSSCTLSNQRC